MNPSELSFSSGYSFGNPTNLFWKLIPTAGIFDDLQDIHPKGDFTRPSWEPGQKAPKSRIHPSAQMLAPEIGIGFTDVGFEVGSRSSKYSPAMVRSWCTAPDTGLYARLTNHCRRVQRDVSIVLGDDVQIEDCAPSILAFTGKVRPALCVSVCVCVCVCVCSLQIAETPICLIDLCCTFRVVPDFELRKIGLI